MTPNDLTDFVARLRAYGKGLEGDGFGRIGDLKAAIKRTCVRLEEVAHLIETLPPPDLKEYAPDKSNPDCLGNGGDNILDCACRKIFEAGQMSADPDSDDYMGHTLAIALGVAKCTCKGSANIMCPFHGR